MERKNFYPEAPKENISWPAAHKNSIILTFSLPGDNTNGSARIVEKLHSPRWTQSTKDQSVRVSWCVCVCRSPAKQPKIQ